jgi:16S rRNA (uracil1498-N3)-methyltransferase
VLVEVNQKSCKVEIVEKEENYEKRPYYLHIAIAPTKSNDRFEWFLEKATEIGIDKITPIICDHSERRKIRSDRLEKVILSAVKQSKKAWLPELSPLIGFKEFIKQAGMEEQKYIAHCREGERPELIKILNHNSSLLILIGPEGDFSEEEIMIANTQGFSSVSLGKSRLRTETAGIVASQICSDIQSISEL